MVPDHVVSQKNGEKIRPQHEVLYSHKTPLRRMYTFNALRISENILGDKVILF